MAFRRRRAFETVAARTRIAALVALVLTAALPGVARGAGGLPEAAQAADAVVAAAKADDAAALERLAKVEMPDPWLVADELVARGEKDALARFVPLVPEASRGRLAEYVAARLAQPDDAALRKALDAAQAASVGNDVKRVQAAVEGLAAERDDLLGWRYASMRGWLASRVESPEEGDRWFARATDLAERLGFPAGPGLVLLARASAAISRKDYRRALDLTERQAHLDGKRGAPAAVSAGLLLTGFARMFLGDEPKAKAAMQRALAVASGSGNDYWAGLARASLLAVGAAADRGAGLRKEAERQVREREAAGDLAGTAFALDMLAPALDAGGDLAKAIECVERAVAAHEAAGNRPGVADDLQYLARLRLRTGNLAGAAEAAERALAAFDAIGERGKAAGARAELGFVRFAQGDSARGQADIEAALAVGEEIGDSALVARTSIALAMVHRTRGKPQEARSALARAVTMLGRMSDDLALAAARAGLGAVELLLGDLDAARGHLEAAVPALERGGDLSAAAEALGNLVTLYRERGDYPRSLAAGERALASKRALGEGGAVGGVLANLAGTHLSLGNLTEALAVASEGAALLEKSGDRGGAGRATVNVASAHLALGAYAKALSACERAAELAEAAGDRSAAVGALVVEGGIRSQLGQAEGALAVLARARLLAEAIGDRSARATGLLNLGTALLPLGRHEEARQAFEAALALHREAGDRATAAVALGNLGIVAEAAGDDARALASHREALAIKEALGQRASAALSLVNVASVERRTGERDAARADLRRAIETAREADAGRVVVMGTIVEATFDFEDGRFADAARRAREAVDAMPGLVRALGEEQGSVARGQVADAFAVGARAARVLSDPAALSYFLESGRAGNLLEALGGRERLRAAAIPRALRDEESRAQAEVREAGARHRAAVEGGRRDEVATSRARWEETHARLQAAVERIQREAKAGADVAYPRADSIEEIRGRLSEGEAFVAYGMLPEEALALVATRSEARVVPLGPPGPIEKAAGALALDTAGSEHAAAVAALRALAAEPLGLPAGTRRVLVSPDGVLPYVPFALLLGDRDVAYEPSGTTHGVLLAERDARGQGVLALGDPDYGARPDPTAVALHRRGGLLAPLPATRDEARAVGDVVLLGADATEARLRDEVAKRTRWRAVHLACHGLIDAERPLLSSLALTPAGEDDGFLTALEAFRSRMPADLVVLSACETAKGRVYAAEGIVGLVRAFMLAGTPRVLCSLWKVDDRATLALMTEFYALWNPKDGTPGLPAAAALRAAQAHVRDFEVESVDEAASQAAGHEVRRKARPWSHPYYWAAWVLWGLPT